MDPEDDDMPPLPLKSRHQNRQPSKTGGRQGQADNLFILPPERLAERKARLAEYARRAAKGLPLFPGDNDD